MSVVANRKLFRKANARNKLRSMGGIPTSYDMPTGILASSQPLVDEVVKQAQMTVRQPEVSAIPVDMARGIMASRSPTTPRPMMQPMPMPQPVPPMVTQPMMPMPAPQPPMMQQQAPVRMEEGGEVRRRRRRKPSDPVDISEQAGSVVEEEDKADVPGRRGRNRGGARTVEREEQEDAIDAATEAVAILNDPTLTPKQQVEAVTEIGGGDPKRDKKKAAADTFKKLGFGKLRTDQSFSKMAKDINSAITSRFGFNIAASKNPRLSGAIAEAGGKAQDAVADALLRKETDLRDLAKRQQLAEEQFERDQQLAATGQANALALLKKRAELGIGTGTDSRFAKEPTYRETLNAMVSKLVDDLGPEEALRVSKKIVDPQFTEAERGIQTAPSGGAQPPSNEEVINSARQRIKNGQISEKDMKELLIKEGYPEAAAGL